MVNVPGMQNDHGTFDLETLHDPFTGEDDMNTELFTVIPLLRIGHGPDSTEGVWYHVRSKMGWLALWKDKETGHLQQKEENVGMCGRVTSN